MTTNRPTEHGVPLSNLISRIANLIAPAEAKAPASEPARVSTREVLTEIRAGKLTRAHVGKTISLRDGGRGKILRIDRRVDVQSGRPVTDVETDRDGLRTYGTATVLLVAELKPRPARIVRTSAEQAAKLEDVASRAAEYAAEKAPLLAAEARIPTLTPRLRTSGILAGMIV